MRNEKTNRKVDCERTESKTLQELREQVSALANGVEAAVQLVHRLEAEERERNQAIAQAEINRLRAELEAARG